MANTKSAKKAARQSLKRQAENRIMLGGSRTAVRRARVAIAAGDPEASQVAVAAALRTLDRAANKNVIHSNNASRRKSRLMKAQAKALKAAAA